MIENHIDNYLQYNFDPHILADNICFTNWIGRSKQKMVSDFLEQISIATL